MKILLRLDDGDTIGITELPRIGDIILTQLPNGAEEGYLVERVIWDYRRWTPDPTVYVHATSPRWPEAPLNVIP